MLNRIAFIVSVRMVMTDDINKQIGKTKDGMVIYLVDTWF